MATITDLTTIYAVVLGAITPVQSTDITAPAPLNLVDVQVVSTATDKTVSASAISTYSSANPSLVSYSTVATTDEVTNESLNRTAESLKTSVNTQLAAFAGNINTGVNRLRDETDASITSLVGEVNAKLVALKTEQNGQVDGINTQIDLLIADLNDKLGVLRVKNLQTSSDVATKINDVAGQLTVNIEKVKQVADNAQAKIAALDDVYKTDTEAAARIALVNDLIATLNGADLGFIQAVDGVIDQVNHLKKTLTTSIVMNSGTGTYNFNLAAEGFGEFVNSADYVPEVEVLNNGQVSAAILAKTVTGFTISCTSLGVHFRPQPIDGSVTPVVIVVTVVHTNRDPLTFNVDTLTTSFVVDGASNTLGSLGIATALAATTVGGTVDIGVTAVEGLVTVTSIDPLVATGAYVAGVLTITGVGIGATTVYIHDTIATRAVEVSVA